jgi:hypothetical protein
MKDSNIYFFLFQKINKIQEKNSFHSSLEANSYVIVKTAFYLPLVINSLTIIK